MKSDDHSVTLTTHRVIHETDKGRQQIMLEDFQEYNLQKMSIGNYPILTVIFLILFLGSMVFTVVHYIEARKNSNFNLSFFDYPLNFFVISTFALLLISTSFLIMARRYYIRIKGKYNNLQIRIRNPKRRSVKKFLDLMTHQVNILKQGKIDRTATIK